MRGMQNKSQSRRDAQQVVRKKMFITKGDRVRVMTGEHAGSEGVVIRVLPKKGRVVVDDVNVITKHKRGSGNDEGGIIHYPAPIDASNVMLLDPKTGEPTRVRRKKDKDGTVERLSRKSGQPIPRNR
jgi:large subunit ribosomal protein L24